MKAEFDTGEGVIFCKKIVGRMISPDTKSLFQNCRVKITRPARFILPAAKIRVFLRNSDFATILNTPVSGINELFHFQGFNQ